MNPFLPWVMHFGPVRRQIIRRLTSAFAEALQRPVPDPAGRSWREMLETLARFTREGTDSWIRCGLSEEDLGARFFARASLLGKEVRARFRVRTPGRVLVTARLFYKTIGIDFRGTGDGRVLVPRCAFSAIYSGATCRVVSAFDDGFLYGLSEGMHLTFLRRITEGAGSCEARLVRESPR